MAAVGKWCLLRELLIEANDECEIEGATLAVALLLSTGRTGRRPLIAKRWDCTARARFRCFALRFLALGTIVLCTAGDSPSPAA